MDGTYGDLTKTCENCHGEGSVTTVRDARLNELSDAQIQSLTQADLYRETGGEEQQEKMERMEQQANQAQSQSPNTRTMSRNPSV